MLSAPSGVIDHTSERTLANVKRHDTLCNIFPSLIEALGAENRFDN